MFKFLLILFVCSNFTFLYSEEIQNDNATTENSEVTTEEKISENEKEDSKKEPVLTDEEKKEWLFEGLMRDRYEGM